MNAEEYRSLVAELVASYPPETAARLIEAACHPPYRPPLRVDVGQARAAARREAAGAEGGAA